MINKKSIALVAGLMLIILIPSLLFGCAPKGGAEQPSDRSLGDVKQRGKLVVGTSTNYKPMEFYGDNNELVGLDMDIAKEIASQLDISLEMKDYLWNELLDAASSGEIDFAISSMTITPERSQKMLFSSPYFNGGQVIVVRSDTENILSPDDLIDKKVAAGAGTTSEKAALEYVQPSAILNIDDYGPELTVLLNGTVDAVIIDYVAAVDYVKISSDKLKIVGEPFSQEYYGIATKLGNNALMDEINRILRDMKRTGKLDEIKNKWLK